MTQTLARAASPLDPAADLRRRDAAVISRAYARYSDLVVESADGAHLRTADGRDVLDFGSGIGVVNLGHGHPRVVAAVHAQVDRLWHTSVTALHPVMVEAAERLVAASPSGLDRVFWANSGAEAVEGAIKLARKATGRQGIVAFDGAFHGRTYGALTLTASKARYRAGVGPLLPGVHHVRYGSLDAIDALFHTRLDPRDAAAIVVEPVLGEGGYVVPPDGFLPGLRRLCDAHGIVLVVDEVQTGVGRTGRMFACEHWGVAPDVMTVAKGLGNGLPVAAVVARRDVMDAWRPGDHGTTFGGNPVSCAAAAAVLDTVAAEGLCDRARRLGASAMLRLRGWSAADARVHDVRGLGLMIGVEMRTPDGAAMPDTVAAVVEAALRRDVLVLTCGTTGSVLRIVPPLTIPEEDLEAGLDRLEAAMGEVLA